MQIFTSEVAPTDMSQHLTSPQHNKSMAASTLAICYTI